MDSMAEPPLVSRPRPPRSRNGRLASSQNSNKGSSDSTTALNAFLPVDEDNASKTARWDAAHLALIGALDILTPPATPPMEAPASMKHSTSALEQSHGPSGIAAAFATFRSSSTSLNQHARDSSREDGRSPQELGNMLEEARRIIHERETELGIAASIGKSLLESNIALRAKQDALLQRVQQHQQEALSPLKHSSPRSSAVTSPSSVKGKGRAHSAAIIPFPSLLIPKAYGAHGEYVEGLPPPSPRQSLSRSATRSSVDLKIDLASLFNHQRSRTASNASTSSAPSVASMRSPPCHLSKPQRIDSPLRHRQGHHRRSSSSSTLGHTLDAVDFTSMSRSSSTKSIAELHSANLAQQRQLQLEIQRLRLSEQNAELEGKLQELEDEVSKADISGKRKLRRLDKELVGLKKELESALERNKELEERLNYRQSMVLSSMAPGTARRGDIPAPQVHVRTESDISDPGRRPEVSVPPDTDTDNHADVPRSLCITDGSRVDEDTTTSHADMQVPSIDKPFDAFHTENIVSQLIAKINELQDANSHISAHKEALNEKLSLASTQFEEMKRKYDFLEERVIEAEIRNHRILELEDGETVADEAILALDWPAEVYEQPKHECDSISPATKLKRKAAGNRPRIEQYRRLSSLYGDQARSALILDPSSAHGSPPRRGIHGPVNSREVTPQKDATLHVHTVPRSSSINSRLSVSPARSTSSTASKGRSRAGSFFDTEAPEDIITSMRRDLQEQREVFQRDQGNLSVDKRELSDDDAVLGGPPSEADVFPRHRHHSLASEIGSLWGSPARNQHESSEIVTSVDIISETVEARLERLSPRDPSHETRIIHSTSAHSLKGYDETFDTYSDNEEDDLSGLMPNGPADAQTYDDLQAHLQDVAVRWEDDLYAGNCSARKRISGPGPSKAGPSSVIPWVYEDAESDNSDNDPWKEESHAQHSIESATQVQIREKAEARTLRRRRRLEQLARQLVDDDDSDASLSMNDKLALVRISSNDSDGSQAGKLSLKRSSSRESLDYEDEEHADIAEHGGTDYWPLSYKARYAPNVVAMRVQKTSQEYLNMCLLWTKFLAVLAVAVIFSIWRGPEAGLGVRGRSRRRLHPSKAGTGSQVILRKPRNL